MVFSSPVRVDRTASLLAYDTPSPSSPLVFPIVRCHWFSMFLRRHVRQSCERFAVFASRQNKRFAPTSLTSKQYFEGVEKTNLSFIDFPRIEMADKDFGFGFDASVFCSKSQNLRWPGHVITTVTDYRRCIREQPERLQGRSEGRVLNLLRDGRVGRDASSTSSHGRLYFA